MWRRKSSWEKPGNECREMVAEDLSGQDQLGGVRIKREAASVRGKKWHHATGQAMVTGLEQRNHSFSLGRARNRIGRVRSRLRQSKCWKVVLQAFHWVVWSWD